MARRTALVLMCLGLAWGGMACAPQLVGPTPGAGYRFSLEVSDPVIWIGQGPFPSNGAFPHAATVIVRVQDAQERPVDDVPVTFEVEPGWARSITLALSHTSTRGGIARAMVYAPQTTGVVHVMARVDTLTAQAKLTVQRYAGSSNAGVQ